MVTFKGKMKGKKQRHRSALRCEEVLWTRALFAQESNQPVMNNNDLFLTKNNGKAACRATRGQSLASDAVFGQGAFTTHTRTHMHTYEGCPKLCVHFYSYSPVRTIQEISTVDLLTQLI